MLSFTASALTQTTINLRADAQLKTIHAFRQAAVQCGPHSLHEVCGSWPAGNGDSCAGNLDPGCSFSGAPDEATVRLHNCKKYFLAHLV